MKYSYFTFDDISSEKYNLIIQNKGEDLSYPSQPNFENQVVSPLYQGTSYLAGINKKERIFNFNCWADSLTYLSLKEMLNWLSVNKISKLVLDYNPDFFYNVKIASISDFRHMAINMDETANYEFTISFVTVEDFAAQSLNSYTSVSGVGSNGLPLGTIIGNDIYFYNTYSLPMHIDFTINSTSGILIKKNDVKYYEYPVNGNYSLNSKYGLCINSNNQLIEEVNSNMTFINLGPLLIDSNLRTINATVVDSELIFNPITILPSTNIFVSGNLTLYNTLSYNNIIEDLNLQEGDNIVLNCFEPVKITLSSGITYSYKFRDNF